MAELDIGMLPDGLLDKSDDLLGRETTLLHVHPLGDGLYSFTRYGSAGAGHHREMSVNTPN
ncbi:MAG TPA: hypothetical protein VGE19_11740 [Pseudoxanthomonas sp.]